MIEWTYADILIFVLVFCICVFLFFQVNAWFAKNCLPFTFMRKECCNWSHSLSVLVGKHNIWSYSWTGGMNWVCKEHLFNFSFSHFNRPRLLLVNMFCMIFEGLVNTTPSIFKNMTLRTSYLIYLKIKGVNFGRLQFWSMHINISCLIDWQTFSQLCVFNYDTKNVEVRHAPWHIQDEPRFAFRGLLLGKVIT